MPAPGFNFLSTPESAIAAGAGQQSSTPTVTPLTDGGYVITWESRPTGGVGGADLAARIYDSSGAALGVAFPLATTAFEEVEASITATADGGFLLVWTERHQEGWDWTYAIKARKFDSHGNPAGSETVIDAADNVQKGSPSVAELAGGGFAVAWADYAVPNSFGDIQVQLLNADGAPIGAPSYVNNPSIRGVQIQPVVSPLGSGGFVIVWADNSTNFPGLRDWALRGQIFDESGSPVDGGFHVTDNIFGDRPDPVVTLLDSGDFVVAWETEVIKPYAWGSVDHDVRARIFDATGTPLGAEIPVNGDQPFDQRNVSLSALPGGGFITSWDTELYGDIHARLFDGLGNPASEIARLNADHPNSQQHSGLAVLPNGAMVAVWSEAVASSETIVGRRFVPGSPPQIIGTSGPDQLDGTAADDLVRGGGGNDLLDLRQGGDDYVIAGPGDDEIRFGGTFDGDDSIDGGPGNDRLVVEAPARTSVDLANRPLLGVETLLLLSSDGGAGSVEAGQYYYWVSVSNWTLSAGTRLTIDGSSLGAGEHLNVDARVHRLGEVDGTFHLLGGAGDDHLEGGELGDRLDGGAGDDILVPGRGGDLMNGGVGDDTYFVDDAQDQVAEATGAGTDTVYSSTSTFVLPAGVENLFLVEGARTGEGNASANVIRGDLNVRDAPDILRDSSGGDDSLYGGRGADALSVVRTTQHSSSRALLDGGAQNDALSFFDSGFNHHATLIGGAGDDLISATRGASIVIDAGEGRDQVTLQLGSGTYDVTLGGTDVLILGPEGGTFPNAPLLIRQFRPGDYWWGDRFELTDFLYAMLRDWDPYGNPFATGHLALFQDGNDAVLRIDVDGSGPVSFLDLARFENRAVADFTTFSLGGYPIHGGLPEQTVFYANPPRDGALWGTYVADLFVGSGQDD